MVDDRLGHEKSRSYSRRHTLPFWSPSFLSFLIAAPRVRVSGPEIVLSVKGRLSIATNEMLG